MLHITSNAIYIAMCLQEKERLSRLQRLRMMQRRTTAALERTASAAAMFEANRNVADANFRASERERQRLEERNKQLEKEKKVYFVRRLI